MFVFCNCVTQRYYCMFLSSRISLHPTFPWRCESLTHLPGGSQSVAHQFIRCVLHQLAPNGVFYQVFLTQKDGKYAFSRTV